MDLKPIQAPHRYYIIAVAPCTDHFRDTFRRILQIRIDYDYRTALSVVTGCLGTELTETPGAVQKKTCHKNYS